MSCSIPRHKYAAFQKSRMKLNCIKTKNFNWWPKSEKEKASNQCLNLYQQLYVLRKLKSFVKLKFCLKELETQIPHTSLHAISKTEWHCNNGYSIWLYYVLQICVVCFVIGINNTTVSMIIFIFWCIFALHNNDMDDWETKWQ